MAKAKNVVVMLVGESHEDPIASDIILNEVLTKYKELPIVYLSETINCTIESEVNDIKKRVASSAIWARKIDNVMEAFINGGGKLNRDSYYEQVQSNLSTIKTLTPDSKHTAKEIIIECRKVKALWEKLDLHLFIKNNGIQFSGIDINIQYQDLGMNEYLAKIEPQRIAHMVKKISEAILQLDKDGLVIVHTGFVHLFGLSNARNLLKKMLGNEINLSFAPFFAFSDFNNQQPELDVRKLAQKYLDVYAPSVKGIYNFHDPLVMKIPVFKKDNEKGRETIRTLVKDVINFGRGKKFDEKMLQVVKHTDTKNIIHEGNSAFKNGKYSEAIFKFEQVVMREPTNITARYNLARSYHKQFEFDEKQSNLDNAVKNYEGIETAKALYHLGMCHLQKNNKEQAKQCFIKVKELAKSPSEDEVLKLADAELNKLNKVDGKTATAITSTSTAATTDSRGASASIPSKVGTAVNASNLTATNLTATSPTALSSTDQKEHLKPLISNSDAATKIALAASTQKSEGGKYK